uniref:Uncharacterized protein n=1 Tax=Physcomitrium patens TaxID=3218 RepID=A0A2K1L3A1_PHYPA|nr:hypothetical protein PHYPA_003300 [Physcomitrium patens]
MFTDDENLCVHWSDSSAPVHLKLAPFRTLPQIRIYITQDAAAKVSKHFRRILLFWQKLMPIISSASDREKLDSKSIPLREGVASPTSDLYTTRPTIVCLQAFPIFPFEDILLCSQIGRKIISDFGNYHPIYTGLVLPNLTAAMRRM